MTEFENSNIMRRRKELSEDIENIFFQYLDRSDNNGCFINSVLCQPDFLVVIGHSKQVSVVGNFNDRPMCKCFYGGEKMECVARNLGPEPKKDSPDEYFGIGKKSGEKIREDVYTGCPIRKLAQIVRKAYWQGKAEGQK